MHKLKLHSGFANSLLGLLLAMVLMPLGLKAQSQTTGDITGLVTDPSGAVVPSAPVVLTDVARGSKLERHTNAQGVYRFPLLIPGRYTINVTAAGFSAVEETATISVGQVLTVDIKLELAAAGRQEVVVTTEAAASLQTDNPNLADTITETQITELPNPGNDISYIAQIAAGSTMNTQSGYGNFSSFGMPATSNLFTLDGMDDNDPFLNLNNSGATNLLLGQNEIAETSVQANSYTGEYGSLAGANINYVTKGGTNRFHGNINYEWNGRAMNSNDFFNNEYGVSKPYSNANQYGATIGGPIKKDKMFFFFDAEGLYVLLPTSIPTNVPTPQFENEVIGNLNSAGLTASVPFYHTMFNLFNGAPGIKAAADNLGPGQTLGGAVTPDGCSTYLPTTFSGPCALTYNATPLNGTHERIYAGRFDTNIGNKDRLFVHFQQDHGLQATYTDPFTPLFDVASVQPEYQGQISETHTFGPTAVNQLIIFTQWYSAIFKNNNQATTLAAFPTTLLLGDASLGGSTPGVGYSLGGENFIFPQGRVVTQYGFSDDFTKTQGNHSLKFGFKFARHDVSDHDYGVYAIGLLVPFSLADFAAGGVGPEGDELVQNFPNSLDLPMATWNMGTYAQDAWKVRSNLTFNFGLRVEHDSNPVCQYNCFARMNGEFDAIKHDPTIPYNQVLLSGQHQALSGLQSIIWEPRAGFAWQPLGVSKNTVIRGGFGISGDAFPATVADYFSENAPLYNSFTAYFNNMAPTETTGNLFNDTRGSNASFIQGYKTGQTVGQIESSNPTFAPPSMYASDKMTHVPTYEKWSIAVEQKVGQHTNLSLSYEGNRGYHEYVSNAGVNAYAPASSYPDGFKGLPSSAPDSRFGPVDWITSAGTSAYRGLTASLKETAFHGLLLDLNYTYSHADDTVSNGGVLPYSYDTNTSPLSPQNPYNIQGNHGYSDYDVRHYFSGDYVWQVPIRSLVGGHGPKALVDGWQLSGTIFSRTGLPYTPFDYDNSSGLINYGSAQNYANFNAQHVSSCSSPRTPCLYSSDFSSASTGFGNIVRNSFRGPGYFDTDMTIMKYINIPHWEAGKLAIGAQAYNLFNHPNFDNPEANIDSSSFGQILKAIGPPTSILGAFLGGDASVRMIQLTGRLVF